MSLSIPEPRADTGSRGNARLRYQRRPSSGSLRANRTFGEGVVGAQASSPSLDDPSDGQTLMFGGAPGAGHGPNKLGLGFARDLNKALLQFHLLSPDRAAVTYGMVREAVAATGHKEHHSSAHCYRRM